MPPAEIRRAREASQKEAVQRRREEDAKRRIEEEKRQREEQARRRAEEEARQRAESQRRSQVLVRKALLVCIVFAASVLLAVLVKGRFDKDSLPPRHEFSKSGIHEAIVRQLPAQWEIADLTIESVVNAASSDARPDSNSSSESDFIAHATVRAREDTYFVFVRDEQEKITYLGLKAPLGASQASITIRGHASFTAKGDWTGCRLDSFPKDVLPEIGAVRSAFPGRTVIFSNDEQEGFQKMQEEKGYVFTVGGTIPKRSSPKSKESDRVTTGSTPATPPINVGYQCKGCKTRMMFAMVGSKCPGCGVIFTSISTSTVDEFGLPILPGSSRFK